VAGGRGRLRPAGEDVVRFWAVTKQATVLGNNGVELSEYSAPPARFAQAVKYVIIVLMSHPRRPLAHVLLDGVG
jgi:hypothetical protein